MKTDTISTYTIDPRTVEERNFWYPQMVAEPDITAATVKHAAKGAWVFPPETAVKTTEAVKHDSNKCDWSLMPFEAVEEINKALEFGAKKYSAHNWKEGGGFRYTRILNSLLRHIFSYIRGEDRDPESGLSHLAHAGCNIIFLLYYERYKSKYNNDDRVKE